MPPESPLLPLLNFPVTHALLTHDGLMTPKLMQVFGDVSAQQTGIVDEGAWILRRSVLCQTVTGAPVLQARLSIFKAAVPDGFLDRLLSGTRLFGSLVIEAGLTLRMSGQTIFRRDSPDKVGAIAWGRRHRFLLAGNDYPICDVEEWLTDEETLQKLVLPAERGRLGLT